MRQLSVSQIRMHCSALQTIRMHQGQEEGRVVVEEEERGRLWRLGLTCTLSAPTIPFTQTHPTMLLHSSVACHHQQGTKV